jgi:regulator of sirC expression with transglutaminase-like and TPR domain
MDAVARFLHLVAGAEPALDEAALAVASGADPELDRSGALAELDRLSDGVSDVDSLVNRLFVEAGFTGNAEDYYDPRNSLLPDVLDRRTGIPITLAIVAMEVGRRAGVPLEGVGMPGHFLVRTPGTQHYLDVFDRGRRIDRAGCEALFRQVTGVGPETRFGAHLLSRVSTRQLLARMLENLRGIYRERSDHQNLEWVLRMRLGLRHEGPELVRELAEVLGAQARWDEAARLLESWADGPGRGARTGQDVLDEVRYEARRQRAHLN